MNIVVNWLLSALSLLIVSNYVSGFNVDSFITALVVALTLGIINTVIKPIIVLFTMPLNILTLGLFTFVINAFMILLVSYLVSGFTVSGFTPALIASLLLWLINIIIHFIAFPTKAA